MIRPVAISALGPGDGVDAGRTIPIRAAISGVAITLVLGLLTACGPTPAGSGGLVGRMMGIDDTGLPDHAIGGGGLAVLPVDVMDGPFWEATGEMPITNPDEWVNVVAKLSEADVAELGGTTSVIEEDGDFRITARPGEYVVCYWLGHVGVRVTGCADLELPREGELAASYGEGGFGIAVK